MKHLLRILRLSVLLLPLLAVGCRAERTADTVLTASIPPVRYLVSAITCNDFPVEVLLPAGSNPEFYSPTAQQLAGLEGSELIFTTGLFDFEQELLGRTTEGIPADRIVNLSTGIDLLTGHHHVSDEATHDAHYDPHIWTSPERLKRMAATAYDAIHRRFPDSVRYPQAYEALIGRLDEASRQIADRLATSGTRTFVIYHPALGYYAADYGCTQLALEDEGKEPSAQHVGDIIRRMKAEGIHTILYQQEFPAAVVAAVADDTQATASPVNPLAEDIVGELLRITDLITRP